MWAGRGGAQFPRMSSYLLDAGTLLTTSSRPPEQGQYLRLQTSHSVVSSLTPHPPNTRPHQTFPSGVLVELLNHLRELIPWRWNTAPIAAQDVQEHTFNVGDFFSPSLSK